MTISTDPAASTESATVNKNLDAGCADTATELARIDGKASLFSELLGSRGGRWRSFIRTRRIGNQFGWLCLKALRSERALAGRGPHVADGAPVEWGPASVRRVAVSHEIRWSLSGRKWLGPAQCFADTARHSARRKVRIAGRSSPRVVE
ncbi:hypothetical protein OH736_45315 (plasmid) [Streptomyces sp. NBC_01650]|uniref:hypothetical protein n=1 Tax=Streptomyces sp. NBC_01650 TaxID=2975907 RepID=UPI002F90AFB8|nr:hypothetical protein OH736_45315 [Streptomyces sp. NBC_01650]